MSRFSDYDDYEGEPEQILAAGRWERNARAALKGKRGRKALKELREALMALPEHKLIEGAACTVGAAKRKAALLAEAEREKAFLDGQFAARYGPSELDTEHAEELDRLVERDGEGVCAIAAFAWHKRVKAGADPAEAFDALPLVLGAGGSDPSVETADLGVEAGLTFTLAYELAYRNDETYSALTPEQRWTHFVAWIDAELAGDQPVKAGATS